MLFIWCVWLYFMFEVNDKFVGFIQREYLYWKKIVGDLGSVVKGDCYLFVKFFCQFVKMRENKIVKQYNLIFFYFYRLIKEFDK